MFHMSNSLNKFHKLKDFRSSIAIFLSNENYLSKWKEIKLRTDHKANSHIIFLV